MHKLNPQTRAGDRNGKSDSAARSSDAPKRRAPKARNSKSSSPGYRRSAALFARNFLKHPKMLGSLIPSSRFLIGRVLSQVDWEKAQVIVEYGPGVGTFTAQILKRMRSDATLLAFETNCDFVQYLRDSFRDPRLHVIHGSAADVDLLLRRLQREHADYVLSGIPFSTMPEEVRDSILRTTHSVLRPDGAFLVYQFSRAVLPYLQRIFGHVYRDFELLNIMPAQVFYCRRNGEPVGEKRNGASASHSSDVCPDCRQPVSRF